MKDEKSAEPEQNQNYGQDEKHGESSFFNRIGAQRR
jgi:hypothetical protein